MITDSPHPTSRIKKLLRTVKFLLFYFRTLISTLKTQKKRTGLDGSKQVPDTHPPLRTSGVDGVERNWWTDETPDIQYSRTPETQPMTILDLNIARGRGVPQIHDNPLCPSETLALRTGTVGPLGPSLRFVCGPGPSTVLVFLVVYTSTSPSSYTLVNFRNSSPISPLSQTSPLSFCSPKKKDDTPRTTPPYLHQLSTQIKLQKEWWRVRSPTR